MRLRTDCMRDRADPDPDPTLFFDPFFAGFAATTGITLLGRLCRLLLDRWDARALCGAKTPRSYL